LHASLPASKLQHSSMSNRRMVLAPSMREALLVIQDQDTYCNILLTRHVDTTKNQWALCARNTKNSCKRETFSQLFFGRLP
jgi:hypothetical protein